MIVHAGSSGRGKGYFISVDPPAIVTPWSILVLEQGNPKKSSKKGFLCKNLHSCEYDGCIERS